MTPRRFSLDGFSGLPRESGIGALYVEGGVGRLDGGYVRTHWTSTIGIVRLERELNRR